MTKKLTKKQERWFAVDVAESIGWDKSENIINKINELSHDFIDRAGVCLYFLDDSDLIRIRSRVLELIRLYATVMLGYIASADDGSGWDHEE